MRLGGQRGQVEERVWEMVTGGSVVTEGKYSGKVPSDVTSCKNVQCVLKLFGKSGKKFLVIFKLPQVAVKNSDGCEMFPARMSRKIFLYGNKRRMLP